jgi:[protein-PII] uridylyltransferase
LSSDYADEIEAHFEFMPDSYFRAHEVPEMVEHLKLFRRFLENLTAANAPPFAPAVLWEPFPAKGHTRVSFYTWDRQQILAKIAGSCSAVPLNILSVDTFGRGDHTVLNVFHVCDTKGRAVTDQRDFDLVEKTLRSALEKENLDFRAVLEKARRQTLRRPQQDLDFPTLIAIDNKAHPTYTLVQIQARDRLGLLYDLVACLGKEGISIALSRISTQNGAALDTFYVTDSASRTKITESQRIAALQKELQAAMEAGTPR